MITRRLFVEAMGAGVLTPLHCFAQLPGKVWRIGFLAQRHVDFTDADYYYGPLTLGLRELGYVVGKNLVIEWRSAEGKVERLPELAAELVMLNIDVLLTGGTPAAIAAQKATVSIPIVMVSVADPVGTGLVKSLARPGGNSTGLSTISGELSPKLLEMLREMVPKVSRVAVLANPSNTVNTLVVKNVLAAGKKIGVKIQPVEARTPEEITSGFAAMARQNAGALIVSQDPLFQQQKNQIVDLAAKHRLPSIAAYSDYVKAGGLMNYGPNTWEYAKRAATYVDKLFKGVKPGDIPVEQPTKFELVVNLKTAKALGIKIPPTIMVQATKMIE